MLASFSVLPESEEGTLELLKLAMMHYVRNPNLTRLIQHAALAGGPQLEIVMKRCYRPLNAMINNHLGQGGPLSEQWDDAKPRLLIINFHSMLFGYINFAPVCNEILDFDCLSEQAAEQQLALLQAMSRKLWG